MLFYLALCRAQGDAALTQSARFAARLHMRAFAMDLDPMIQRKRHRPILLLVALLCLAYGGTAVLSGLLFLFLADPRFLPWWIGFLVGGIVLCLLGAIFLVLRARLPQSPSHTSDRAASEASELDAQDAQASELDAQDAQPDPVFNKDDYLLFDPEQPPSFDGERVRRSERAGEVEAGAFKIYVVDHHPFDEIRKGPGLPPGGAIVDLYDRLSHDPGWWLQHLQQFTLSEVLIDDTDVEIYDWEEQRLILTAQASHRLHNDSHRKWYGSEIFVATLGEERLYGGIIYLHLGPRVFQCPVLSYDLEERSRMVLLLFFSPWYRDGHVLMKLMNGEATRNHFLALHKLGIKKKHN